MLTIKPVAEVLEATVTELEAHVAFENLRQRENSGNGRTQATAVLVAKGIEALEMLEATAEPKSFPQIKKSV